VEFSFEEAAGFIEETFSPNMFYLYMIDLKSFKMQQASIIIANSKSSSNT